MPNILTIIAALAQSGVPAIPPAGAAVPVRRAETPKQRRRPPPLVITPPPPMLMLPPPPAPVPPPIFVPPPPPPPPGSPPTPARMIAGSIDTSDYPAAAIRAEADGTSTIRLHIGADGRVIDCEIMNSAGNVALDAAACSIPRRRFLFRPATLNGAAVDSYQTRRIAWRLPAMWLAFEQGRSTVTVEGNAAGYTSCRDVLTGPTFAQWMDKACDPTDASGLIDRDAMAPGQPPVRVRQVLTLVPDGEAYRLPRLDAAAATLMVHFEIAPDGRTSECRVETPLAPLPAYVSPGFPDLCDYMMRRPRFEAAGDNRVRSGRMQVAIFTEVLVAPAGPRRQ